jgi:AAA domain
VIYLALEGGAGIRNRIAAARERMALPDTTPLVLVQCPVDLCHGNADVAKVIATIKLIAVRLAMPVRIVVVDTLARAMAGGNENASEDMGALVAHSDLIRDQSGACVLYIHHCGKDTARGSRGHSSLKAATDTEIEVTRGAERVSIARVTRQRDMESEGSFGFKLDPMELGRNQRNKPVTSCVVTPADAPPEQTGTAPLTNVEMIAMRCLDQAMKADAIAPASCPRVPFAISRTFSNSPHSRSAISLISHACRSASVFWAWRVYISMARALSRMSFTSSTA